MTMIPPPASRFPRGSFARGAVFGTVAAALSFTAGTPALAQAAGCTDIQKYLLARKSIGDRITAATSGGKKQIDAKVACSNFGQLVSNGQTFIKWINANKDWCQIPDNFVESLKADHGRAVGIRSKACGVAAKQVQMEKQAKEGATSGLLGGPGLSGANKLPQGAL